MGWSSFVEDIRERLTDDLRELTRKLDAGGWIPNAHSEARKILARAEGTVVRLFQELDFATDPTLDLAHELYEERSRRTQVQGDLARAQEHISYLERELLASRKSVKSASQAHRRAQREHRALQDQLASIYSRHPMIMYEEYTDDQRLRRDKPNA